MPQKLLLIDDSQPMLELIKMHLGTEAFVFESSLTGNAAMSVAAWFQPDLILLDVDLPDMNGFDVCRFLKKNPMTARIPVIFLTSSASIDEKVCGLELQAADYITKPFDLEELASRVRAVLRTKRLLDLLSTHATVLPAPPAGSPNHRSKSPLLHATRYQNAWSRQTPSTIADG